MIKILKGTRFAMISNRFQQLIPNFDITLILLYVDMIITRDDSVGIHSLQHFLSRHFKMKDLGTLS